MPWDRRRVRRTASTPAPRVWLPQPESFARYALDRQRGVAGSTYELYRTALRLRREHALGGGELTWVDGAAAGLLTAANGDLLIVANLGSEPAPLPEGAELLAASGDLTLDGRLPVDASAWLRIG